MENKKINKIIITGGGTGGHLIPSFAIADALKKRQSDIRIRFIGSSLGIESKLYKNRDEKYHLINIKGIRRSLSFKAIIENCLIFPFNFVVSFIKVLKIFKEFNPDIVIGTGGYSSAIPLFVANLKKVEIVIQEQNAIPGLVNKLFLKKASKVCFGFKPIYKASNFINTGNPTLLSNSINKGKDIYSYEIDKKLTIFILGGSQGSVPINNHFIKHYSEYLDMGVKLIWQCGEKNIKKIKNAVSNEEIDLRGFINPSDMAHYYNIADLAISRSGALTLSELANFNLPSILIPFPYAANNHQFYNAQYFKSNKSAEIVEQKDLDKGELESKVKNILNDLKIIELMKTKIKKIAKPYAADTIAAEILGI